MKRATKIVVPCACVAAVVVAGWAAWRLAPKHRAYYTDADTIRVPVETTTPRDVLWQPPTRLPPDLNTTGEDYEPRVSADGMTLFFVRGKAGGGGDIFFATRTPDGWRGPQPLTGVNSAYDDLGPEPSADGESLYFYSDRPGGLGGYDVWVARRGPDGWRAPENLGALVNSPFNDYGPALTSDAAVLYFASNRPSPDDTDVPDADAWSATIREDRYHRDYDLYLARLTDAGPGPAEAVAALNTPYNEGRPAVSPVDDFLYFASDRPDGIGGFDLYRARRRHGRHEPPDNLGHAVNTAADELDPALELGGFGLFFSSNRPAGRDRSNTDGGRSGRPNDYDLYYTASREVFRDTERTSGPPINWAALWPVIGTGLLWWLPALLLLAAMLWLLRDMRHRKLGLLARCLVGSAIAHLLLLFLLSLYNVTASIAGIVRRPGGIKVALLSPADAGQIEAQILGGLADIRQVTPAAPPVLRRVAADAVATDAAAVTFAVERRPIEFHDASAVDIELRDARVETPIQVPTRTGLPAPPEPPRVLAVATPGVVRPTRAAEADATRDVRHATAARSASAVRRRPALPTTSSTGAPPVRVDLAPATSSPEPTLGRAPDQAASLAAPVQPQDATLRDQQPDPAIASAAADDVPLPTRLALTAVSERPAAPSREIEPDVRAARPSAVRARPLQVRGAAPIDVHVARFSPHNGASPAIEPSLAPNRTPHAAPVMDPRPTVDAGIAHPPPPRAAPDDAVAMAGIAMPTAPRRAVATAVDPPSRIVPLAPTAVRRRPARRGSGRPAPLDAHRVLPPGPATPHADTSLATPPAPLIADDPAGTAMAPWDVTAVMRSSIAAARADAARQTPPLPALPSLEEATAPARVESTTSGPTWPTPIAVAHSTAPPRPHAARPRHRTNSALRIDAPFRRFDPEPVTITAGEAMLVDVAPPRTADAAGMIRGVVTDADAPGPAGVAGATVRLDLAGREPVLATTRADGSYVLFVPDVPDHFALSASAPGYVPQTRNVAANTLEHTARIVDFGLAPLRKDVIAVESVPRVHHLGNDRFEGRVNSRFQRASEGTSLAAAFTVSAAQLSDRTRPAVVTMLTKGVQCPHRILINGRRIGRGLTNSPRDGRFGEFTADFDASLLRDGVNTIELEAVSCRGDLDDFEFVNVQILLPP